jgi:hypothetical protein
MEYLNSLDNNINNVLENNIFYTILIVTLIIYCTFVSGSANPIISAKMDNPYLRILLILFIVYFATKDIRLSLLLLILFLIELDKLNTDEVNANLVALMVKDSLLEQRLLNLEKK